MIIDTSLTFADGLDAFGAAGTALIGDVVDLQQTGLRLGAGMSLSLVLQVDTAFTGGTSVEFSLVSDAQEAIATDGSASVHSSTGAIPVAGLTAGQRLVIPLPHGSGNEYERYLGVLATRVGTSTAGAIDAFLVETAQDWKSYPDAVN